VTLPTSSPSWHRQRTPTSGAVAAACAPRAVIPASMWRADENLAWEWLTYLGGSVRVADLAREMGCDEHRAWTACMRLLWRGGVTFEPGRTWRAVDSFDKEERR